MTKALGMIVQFERKIQNTKFKIRKSKYNIQSYRHYNKIPLKRLSNNSLRNYSSGNLLGKGDLSFNGRQ